MGNDFYFHQGSNSSWSVSSGDFPFPFLLAYAAVCPISFHRFLPVIWKMSYIWWVAEYWVAPCSSFTEHSSGADTGFKCIFHHMYGPVIDSCSDRIVRSDGKGLKRLHIRIYYCSVGCRLADIQRKFHSSDITFGRFTDSSSFPVMGVLQSCHSESHPEIFSGFHHQKIFSMA